MGYFEREANPQSALPRSKDDGSIYEMGSSVGRYGSEKWKLTGPNKDGD